MAKLTITEALQEIKTINKRIEKKRLAVGGFIARDSRIRDPLEKDGGSEKYVSEERQAVCDLEQRVVNIRTAIQRSNLESPIQVGDKTRTVAEWLTWRREVAPGQKSFLGQLVQGLANVRNETQKKGGRVLAAAVAVNEVSGPNDPPQVVVSVDEKKLLQEQEALETILGDLDGKLSLFNATTMVDV